MKRFALLTFTAFVALAVGAFAQPKLEIVGGTTYDWGNVGPKESPLTAEIKLKNVGTEELHISNVKPGCGCTTAPLEKDRLAPGETTKIDVSLKVGSATGPLSKSITISSTDAANPKQILTLKANIVRPVQVNPRYFYFNTMAVGGKTTAKVSIKNTSKKDIKLSGIESTNGVEVNLKEGTVLKAGQEIEVSATVIPDKEGYFNSTFTVKTDHPEYPELEIKGYGNVKKPEKSSVFVD